MRVALGLSIVLSSGLALASNEPAPPSPTQEQFHWQVGPRPLQLGHQISLALPAGYAFLGMPDADRFLRQNGSFDNANTLGVVLPVDEKQTWAVIIDYDESGHVDDTEKLDAAEVLKSLKEGTEQANEERVKNGFPAIHVGDWSEPPHYDRATHRLIWALPAASERGTTLNYNTRILGRRGVISIDLLDAPERIPLVKANADALLTATTFDKGARYEDFDKKTDKVAEFGLMGLIAGGVGLGAAKLIKIGLLAKFWKVFLAILIAGKKALIAAFVFVGAGLKRLFGGKKAGAPVAQSETKLPPTGTDGQS